MTVPQVVAERVARYRPRVYRDQLTSGAIGWVAEYQDVPGAVGFGDTQTEAREALRAAAIAILMDMIDANEEMPEPDAPGLIVSEFDLEGATSDPGPYLSTFEEPTLDPVG